MSAPKHFGIGLSLRSDKILLPILLAEKYMVQPEFHIWRQRSTKTNGFEQISNRKNLNFGISGFRKFGKENV